MTPFRLWGEAADRIGPGRWLLEASAGTGKTFAIAGLVARFVVEDGLPIDRIAVMTFTRAATAELRDRIRGNLEQAAAGADGFPAWLRERGGSLGRRRLAAALDRLDGACISTIHGFCQRLLAAHGLGLGTPADPAIEADPAAWREAWCRDEVRRWGIDPALRPWVLVGAVPACASLSEWARDIAQRPEVRLPPAPPLPDPAELPAAVAAARAAFGGPIGRGAAGQARHRAGLAVLAGEWCLADAEVLAGIPGTETKKQPALVRVVDAAAAAMQVPAAVEALALARFRAALDQRMAAADGRLAFQDLVAGVARGLDGGEGAALAEAIGGGFAAVLVDEFQDTDPLQWRILERCFGGGAHRLVLIGDPKQAIYRFRGADLRTYLAARASVPDGQRRTLAVNYRTDRGLHDAVHALIRTHPQPFVDPAIALPEVAAHHGDRCEPGAADPAPVEIVVVEPGDDADRDDLVRAIAAGTAAHLRGLLASGMRVAGRALGAGDVAVLVGDHGEGEVMRQALAATGLPVVALGRDSIYATAEAAELAAALAAWERPEDDAAVRAAAASRLGGLGAAGLADHAACARAAEDAAAAGAAWRERGLLAGWYAWRDRRDLRRRLLAQPRGERVLVNLQHLVELLAAEERGQALGTAGVQRLLAAAIAEAAAGDARGEEHALPRLDQDADAIRIQTIHSAKGLQFAVVAVPFAWRGRQWVGGKVDAEGRWLAGRSQLSDDPGFYDERLAEQARLLYVALTRAEHRLILVWCGHGGGSMQRNRLNSLGSPLGWLLLGDQRTPLEVMAHLRGSGASLTAAGRLRLGLVPGLRMHEGWPAPPRAAPPPSAAAVRAERLAAIPVAGAAPRRQWWPSSYSGLARRIEAERDDDAAAATAADPDDDLPAGAALGTAMHAVFEAALRRAEPLADLDVLAADQLTAHGVATAAIPTLTRLIAAVLARPLPGGGTHLADIPRARRRPEMPVALPVGRAIDLAAVFAHDRDLSRRLAGARLPPGLFTGVIDLVACDGDAWHIVDWKSNRLAGDGDAGIAADLLQHLYPVQYHLYAVALRRWLRAVGSPLPIGGCHVAYVRHGRWHSARPRPETLDALEAGMEEGG